MPHSITGKLVAFTEFIKVTTIYPFQKTNVDKFTILKRNPFTGIDLYTEGEMLFPLPLHPFVLSRSKETFG